MNRISQELEDKFLTCVITCGAPPPIPGDWTGTTYYKYLGSEGLNARIRWLAEVYKLCNERFCITHVNISPFVKQFDEWWLDNRGKYDD